MSQEQIDLLLLKGIVSDCTPAEQADIRQVRAKITEMALAKPAATMMAISLVALEAQCNPKAYGLPG